MVRPSKQDLYLLQNDFGLIKIGRSLHVGERIARLRTSEQSGIAVVVRFRRAGHHEEWSHYALRKYRLHGEWFCGSPEAREAIKKEFELNDVNWPIPYQPDAAGRWLAHMREAHPVLQLKRRIGRQITILRRLAEPSGIADLDIFLLLSDPLVNSVNPLRAELIDGRLTRMHVDRMSGALMPIPGYTAQVSAALSIWPQGAGPSEWSGSAIECCASGLSALNASIARPRWRFAEHL